MYIIRCFDEQIEMQMYKNLYMKLVREMIQMSFKYKWF